MTKQIINKFGERPKAVYRKRSCIVVSEEGKLPRLENCHIFVPTDQRGTERVSASIVVTRTRDAERVRDILKNRYGMTRYPRGKADPSWLVEAWV